MDKNIVEVKNVVKKYGSFTAVNNISFNIKEGNFFSLLGPSGCGKTTTLRVIGGFIEEDSGEILIDGQNMKNVPPNKRNTSLVFQNLALFPHMNVMENITYGLRKRRIPKNIIKEDLCKIINTVNLTGLEKRRINELSGGQQQRVALARSLIIKPKILLLDEPLANLDKKLRISMQFEMKEIQRRSGATFLYVTHDQSEALTMSDMIAVMNEGKIIQIGTPSEIYDNPVNLFVADFIGAGNFIKIKDIKQSEYENILNIELTENTVIRYKIDKSNQNYLNDFSAPFADDTSKDVHKHIFFIRPEKIKIRDDIIEDSGISTDNQENLNIFKGTLDSMVFEGPDIRLIISAAGLGSLKAEIKNDKKYHKLKENHEITFYWEHEDGILF